MIAGARRRLRGVIHVHSTHSYDGQQSIEELARFFRARAMDFVCVTEHSDGLDAAAMQRVATETARVSDDEFLVVPGIEFSCRRRLHLLGLGVTTPIDSDDPVTVARRIRDQGGVVIVAHPLAYGTDYPEDMAEHVDGVEIWNITKDGWLSPGAAPMALWRRWRRRNPVLRGLGALDLHSFASPSGLWLELADTELRTEAVLDTLRGGRLDICNRFLRVGGGAPPGGLSFAVYALASRLYTTLRSARDRLLPDRRARG